jgi:hypothetical protein
LTTQDTITPYKPPNTPANPYRSGGGNITVEVKPGKARNESTCSLSSVTEQDT